MTQLSLEAAISARDEAMETIEKNAGELFRERAKAFVLNYLREHGEKPGEDITDACVKAGIVPHDDRAFGPVYMALARKGLIEKCGLVVRRRGHGTTGGNVWRLTVKGKEDTNA